MKLKLVKSYERNYEDPKEDSDVKFLFEGIRDFEHIWGLDIEMLSL